MPLHATSTTAQAVASTSAAAEVFDSPFTVLAGRNSSNQMKNSIVWNTLSVAVIFNKQMNCLEVR